MSPEQQPSRFALRLSDVIWVVIAAASLLLLVAILGLLFRELNLEPLGGVWANQPVPLATFIAFIGAAMTFIWRLSSRWLIHEVSLSAHSHPALEQKIDALSAKDAHLSDQFIAHMQSEEDHQGVQNRIMTDLQQRLGRIESVLMSQEHRRE